MNRAFKWTIEDTGKSGDVHIAEGGARLGPEKMSWESASQLVERHNLSGDCMGVESFRAAVSEVVERKLQELLADDQTTAGNYWIIMQMIVDTAVAQFVSAVNPPPSNTVSLINLKPEAYQIP